MISSISNNKLTLFRKLNQKKYRDRMQLFLVEGERAIQQIIKNEVIEVKELFFDEAQSLWKRDYWNRNMALFTSWSVPQNDFASVCDTETPQGVAALCKMPGETDEETLKQKEGVILAVDRIRDPGNLGTIIRTAAWFGVQGLLVGKGTVDLFHPKVVRSTAGATGTIPYQKADLNETLPQFEEKGWQVLLLHASDEAENMRSAVKSNRSLIIVGNEANGINENLFVPGRTMVHIPSKAVTEKVESLNAAVALSIALYEFS